MEVTVNGSACLSASLFTSRELILKIWSMVCGGPPGGYTGKRDKICFATIVSQI
jgi:hypothetical protein